MAKMNQRVEEFYAKLLLLEPEWQSPKQGPTVNIKKKSKQLLRGGMSDYCEILHRTLK